MTPTLRAILAALNRNHHARKATMSEPSIPELPEHLAAAIFTNPDIAKLRFEDFPHIGPPIDEAAALIAGMPLPKGAADVVRAAGFPLGTRVTADVVREAMRKRQTASGHDVTEPGPADA